MVFLGKMLASSLTLATALLAGHLVDVRSTTDCPSTSAITERLQPLLPPASAPAAAPDTAMVETVGPRGTDTELRIRLLRAGVEVGDRRVVVRSDCAEAAATVAAVIAAWEIEPLPPAPAAAPAPVGPPAPKTPAV